MFSAGLVALGLGRLLPVLRSVFARVQSVLLLGSPSLVGFVVLSLWLLCVLWGMLAGVEPTAFVLRLVDFGLLLFVGSLVVLRSILAGIQSLWRGLNEGREDTVNNVAGFGLRDGWRTVNGDEISFALLCGIHGCVLRVDNGVEKVSILDAKEVIEARGSSICKRDLCKCDGPGRNSGSEMDKKESAGVEWIIRNPWECGG